MRDYKPNCLGCNYHQKKALAILSRRDSLMMKRGAVEAYQIALTLTVNDHYIGVKAVNKRLSKVKREIKDLEASK